MPHLLKNVAKKAVSARKRGIVAVPDAFGGTEELKLLAPDGHRLMRIEAESGVIDQELTDFLRHWLTHRH